MPHLGRRLARRLPGVARLRDERGHGELVVAEIFLRHRLHLRRADLAQARDQALVGVQWQLLNPQAAQLLRLRSAASASPTPTRR